MKEVSVALAVYVGLAVAVRRRASGSSPGHEYGVEFFAGWLTEYSLSVDNLFIFIIIMAKFAVPRQYQQKALLVGIVLALVMRGDLHRRRRGRDQRVQLGLLHLRRRSWSTPRSSSPGEGEQRRGRVRGEPAHPVGRAAPAGHRRVARRRRSSPQENGKRVVTPMFIVIIALGTTDLLFALDSIPAIFGLTKEPYLVLTANIFALMGLRQLYFLHRRPAGAAGLPVLRPGGAARLHRRQARSCTRCTRTSCRSSTAASRSTGRRTSRSGCRWWSSSASSAVTTVASLSRSRRDERAASRRPSDDGLIERGSGRADRAPDAVRSDPARSRPASRRGPRQWHVLDQPPPVSGACSIRRVPSSATGRVTKPTW